MALITLPTKAVDDDIGASVHTSDSRPKLYENEDQDALQKKTSQYLFNYGIKFMPDIICGARGLYVYTAKGHRVLDWTSGQMSCLLGHGHPEIVQTIADHAAGLDHLFSGMVSPPVISLAERLYSLLPPGLDKAFFLSTGVSIFLRSICHASLPGANTFSRVSPTKQPSRSQKYIQANLRS